MSEQNLSPVNENGGTANIIYILYLVAIAVPITSIVGVIMAYVNRSNAPPWLQSHYRFQIRTFWIGTLYGLIGSVLVKLVIGFAVLLFVLVWWIVRCVKGMRALGEHRPVDNPTSWMV
jgi:uncharacterized membrane protein